MFGIAVSANGQRSKLYLFCVELVAGDVPYGEAEQCNHISEVLKPLADTYSRLVNAISLLADSLMSKLYLFYVIIQYFYYDINLLSYQI